MAETKSSPKSLPPGKVLITGATSGFGLALARQFLLLGREVVITGRNPERLAEAAGQLPAPAQVHCVRWDVTVEAGLAPILRTHPDIAVVVNNAGMQNRYHPEPVSSRAVLEELQVNLAAPIQHLLFNARPLAPPAGGGVAHQCNLGPSLFPKKIRPGLLRRQGRVANLYRGSALRSTGRSGYC